MRDLLYLSETKMKDLVPQLPRKVLKRLGVEGGLNVGVLSLRATVSPDEQTSLPALLDSVINMIENERLTRWPTDPHLHAGDWIQFEETFRYGTKPPDTKHPLPSGDLVYFNAVGAESRMLSLCGSVAHLKGPTTSCQAKSTRCPAPMFPPCWGPTTPRPTMGQPRPETGRAVTFPAASAYPATPASSRCSTTSSSPRRCTSNTPRQAIDGRPRWIRTPLATTLRNPDSSGDQYRRSSSTRPNLCPDRSCDVVGVVRQHLP